MAAKAKPLTPLMLEAINLIAIGYDLQSDRSVNGGWSLHSKSRHRKITASTVEGLRERGLIRERDKFDGDPWYATHYVLTKTGEAAATEPIAPRRYEIVVNKAFQELWKKSPYASDRLPARDWRAVWTPTSHGAYAADIDRLGHVERLNLARWMLRIDPAREDGFAFDACLRQITLWAVYPLMIDTTIATIREERRDV